MSATLITDVSDTALWVAYYRVLETQRPDALFHDPLASRLTGEKGRHIAQQMSGGHYTSWAIAIRTYIIDTIVQELVAQKKIDTILNLGAGLDTRPYRLDLPKTLRWIEVDYPHMISFKEKHLNTEKPNCQLERIPLDLSDRPKRMQLFTKLNTTSHSTLVLTEGIVPYLTTEQGGQLADDLRAQQKFHFWIVDYFAKQALLYMRNGKLKRQLKNAPFQFQPDDWFKFFHRHGWQSKTIRYLSQESEKLGRPVPMPWLVRLLLPFMPRKLRDFFSQLTAYILLERTDL